MIYLCMCVCVCVCVCVVVVVVVVVWHLFYLGLYWLLGLYFGVPFSQSSPSGIAMRYMLHLL
jgi:hypothetical protein